MGLAQDAIPADEEPRKVTVSIHAERRCRQRLGIPRRAVVRTARRAWEFGIPWQVSSRRHYGAVIKLWGEYVWIFTAKDLILLTVIPAVPKVEEYTSVKQFKHDREQIKKRKQRLRKNKRGKRR